MNKYRCCRNYFAHHLIFELQNFEKNFRYVFQHFETGFSTFRVLVQENGKFLLCQNRAQNGQKTLFECAETTSRANLGPYVHFAPFRTRSTLSRFPGTCSGLFDPKPLYKNFEFLYKSASALKMYIRGQVDAASRFCALSKCRNAYLSRFARKTSDFVA